MKKNLIIFLICSIYVSILTSCTASASNALVTTSSPSTNASQTATAATMISSSPTTTIIPPTLPPTPNGFEGPNSTSTQSIDGLNLILSLESTSYKSGQDIYVTIDEHNTLNTDIYVPVANRTADVPLSLGDLCGNDYSFLGIAVFRGVYNSANIAQGTLLPF